MTTKLPPWDLEAAAPDVAVLVALQEEFLGLREGIGVEWFPRKDPEYGGHVYFWIDPGSGYRCAAASAGRMGPGESQRLAERLLRLRPAALVNVGIAASLHGDVRIGDVIVPDIVYAYDKTAKAVSVRHGEAETWDWERRGDAFRATHALVEAARELVTAEPERHAMWQEAGAREYAEIRDRNVAAITAIETMTDRKVLGARPELRVVALGSGNFVGASRVFARWLREANAELKALEMEAAGMLLATEKRGTPTPALVIRGISDHVDVPKAESDAIAEGALRQLAMHNAVRLLRTLLTIGALPRNALAANTTSPNEPPREVPASRGAPAAAATEGSRADGEALAEFRRVMAAVYGTMRFIGIPHARHGPMQAMRDAFVPLKLSRGEFRTAWTPSRLLAHLLAPRPVALRSVVLGVPGSGKTTLCRFLTVVLAGAIELDGIAVPHGLAPLHLVVREYGDVLDDGSPSLLAHLARVAARCGAAISQEHLARLCHAGRAVLLVDGLDEAGDAARRDELRGRLLAFCALYPRVPVCLTTREVGYDEVRLPAAGSNNFVHLTLQPLDDPDLENFVRRWYAAVESDDDLRAGRVADLLARISAEPTVRDLAGNPLLATLIALIHRHEARLPGERVKLYELCVRMLLCDWPAARGKPFAKIDIDLQRAVLERLAVQFSIEQGSDRGGPPLMPHATLVKFLADALQTIAPTAGHTRSDVRQWIEFLHNESGLLSEAGPDHFTFVHRSLQEYLAAACYVRTSPEPELLVARNCSRARDREIWLMMVGLLSDDARTCERLAEQVAPAGSAAWLFLLACLGEEASFATTTVDRILAQAARMAGGAAHAGIAVSLSRLWRFSHRHGPAVERWFTARLGVERGSLPALAWLASAAAPDLAPVLAALDARPDRAWAAAELAVAVWPVDPKPHRDAPALRQIASWAWSRLSLPDALARMSARCWSAAELCGVAYTALTAGAAGPIRATVTLQLALDTLELTRHAAMQPAERRCGGLVTVPGDIHVPLTCRTPLATAPQGGLGPPPSDARHGDLPIWRLTQPRTHFPPCLDRERGFDPNALTHPALSDLNAFDYLVGLDDPRAEDFWIDPLDNGANAYLDEPDEFGDVLVDDVGGNSYPLKEFTHEITEQMDGLRVARSGDTRPISAPDARRGPDPYMLRDALLAARPAPGTEAPPYAPVFDLHAIHAAHVAAAAILFADDLNLQRTAAVLRQQHVWLLQNWHAVERLAETSDDPTTLALLLCLGWVQCTSTAVWPGTPQWRALLGGPAPTHWWPRVLWLLCWLVHAPEDPERLTALSAALAEGDADPALGPLARSFRAVLLLGQ